jgi:hypothetical protein
MAHDDSRALVARLVWPLMRFAGWWQSSRIVISGKGSGIRCEKAYRPRRLVIEGDYPALIPHRPAAIRPGRPPAQLPPAGGAARRAYVVDPRYPVGTAHQGSPCAPDFTPVPASQLPDISADRNPRVWVHSHGRAPVNRLSGHTGPVTKGPRIVAGQNIPLPAVPASC